MIEAYRLAYTDSVTAAFRPRGAAGRWNSRGTVVVYTAEHPALAALELLTAWDDYEDFRNYHLYRCELPEGVVFDAVPDIQQQRMDIHDLQATRQYGDAWAKSNATAVLRVPSAVSMFSYNYLLNPDHPDSDRVVVRTLLGPFRYDERLLTLMNRARRPDNLSG